MAKYPISKGLPKNVSAGEAKVVEIHEKLSGPQAMPGSPPKVNPHIEASFKTPGVPRAN